MSVQEKHNAVDRAALEQMSTPELKDLLCRLTDARTADDTQSETMLAIMEVLKIRSDNMDYIRLDARAALQRFREEFLPSAELAAETHGDAREPSARPDRESAAAVPAFLAAFAAGKQLSAQEEEELRRMIEDFRREA